MAYLDNRVYDNGLTVLDTEANKILITSQEATTFAEANTTYALGNSTTVSVSAPQNRSGGGREVVVAAVEDGAITADGTASHYAIVDTVNSRLLASGSLINPQTVTQGNTFTLGQLSIGIPSPV